MKTLKKTFVAFSLLLVALGFNSCKNDTASYLYTISNETQNSDTALFTYFSSKISFGSYQNYTGTQSECDATAITWFDNIIANAGIDQTELDEMFNNDSEYYAIILYRTPVSSESGSQHTEVKRVTYKRSSN